MLDVRGDTACIALEPRSSECNSINAGMTGSRDRRLQTSRAAALSSIVAATSQMVVTGEIGTMQCDRHFAWLGNFYTFQVCAVQLHRLTTYITVCEMSVFTAVVRTFFYS